MDDGQELGWLVEGGRGQSGCGVCHGGNREVGDFDIVQSNSFKLQILAQTQPKGISYFSTQVSFSATYETESGKVFKFYKGTTFQRTY